MPILVEQISSKCTYHHGQNSKEKIWSWTWKKNIHFACIMTLFIVELSILQ
jgi:hypothetical protein